MVRVFILLYKSKQENRGSAMKIKNIILFGFFFLLIGSLLFSQDLVETAKKEKERRAKLKSKKAVIVTNHNLSRYKGKEAVVMKKYSLAPSFPQPSYKPRLENYQTKEITLPPTSEVDKQEASWKERKAEYEEKWKKTKEYVELLTLKMNGLWQEFYSMDDMTSRDKIQREISETYQKLLKAQEEEARAKKELEKFLIEARKQGALPGWLREKD